MGGRAARGGGVSSALVVLQPGGDVTEVTAATRDTWEPDREGAERARGAFRELGFEVGPMVGLSFSISGPDELFERVFPDVAAKQRTGESFDLSRLPEGAESVQAVVSEPPPAFGPGNP
jgi:hypothetical protein